MDFLQSKIWREFQASVGHEVFEIGNTSIIKQTLPITGDYFYIPRGPEIFSEEIIQLAKKEGAGWIRIEPRSEKVLEEIRNNIDYKIVKTLRDMQPKETSVIDISKSENDILAEMKQKTRYNLNLAKKKNIKVIVSREKKYIDEFLRLVKITSRRDGIISHPENYYRQMIKAIPAENLKIYLAHFENKIIAANVVIFFKNTAIYLHGASDDEYRNVMAPYLLQWKQITDAKKAGCQRYDFGGIATNYPASAGPCLGGGQSDANIRLTKKWEGITRFKIGFSPKTPPTRFPGCYDIILSPFRYWLYRIIQKIKAFL